MKKSIQKTDQGKAVVYSANVNILINALMINEIICYKDKVIAPFEVRWDSIDHAGTDPFFPENFIVEDQYSYPGQYGVGTTTTWIGHLVFNTDEENALRDLFSGAYKEQMKRQRVVLEKEARLLERVEGERGYKTRKAEHEQAVSHARRTDRDFFDAHWNKVSNVHWNEKF